MNFNPKEYWEKRLEDHFNLRGSGCVGFNESYNKYLYSLKESALNKVLDKFSINVKGKSILEIGCGTGFFIEYYKRKGARKILGIDISSISIQRLSKKFPDCEFQILDIAEEPSFNECFDIVNVFDVIYHIIDEDRFKNAILNICSLVCENGYVLITDVFWRSDIHLAKHVHYRSFSKYKQLLLKGGIAILGVFPLYYLMGRSLPVIVANKLALPLYLLDKILQKTGCPNGKNIKLLLGVKHEK